MGEVKPDFWVVEVEYQSGPRIMKKEYELCLSMEDVADVVRENSGPQEKAVVIPVYRHPPKEETT